MDHLFTRLLGLQTFFEHTNDRIGHRGLKLDGAIGQGEICNSLKSENFSKSFLSHIGKNNFLAIMKH